MIVVDTNVVSELMRAAPSASVRDWMLEQRQAELFTTSITVAEILYGIERHPDGQRKETLRAAATDLFASFEDHVLAFDQGAAAAYAPIFHRRDLQGLPIAGFDAQKAAICGSHHATLATRNSKDFKHTGITLVDPWTPT